MLHWRRVPFFVQDHTDTESRTMARIAVLCALTYEHKKEQKKKGKNKASQKKGSKKKARGESKQ